MICYLKSERWSTSSSSWISLRDNKHETVVKENDGGGWSSDGLVLWLDRIEMTLYSSGVRVGLFGEGGRRLWCRFNASVSTQEGR
jgi:hypothetical protein